jgi:hypothetical protein
MQLLSPQLQIEIFAGKLTGEEKGCCFAGQMALFRNRWAAVPEGPTNKATPATGSFGEFKLLYKNINLNAPCGVIAGS